VSRGRQLGAEQHLEPDGRPGASGASGMGAVPGRITACDQSGDLPRQPGHQLVGSGRGVQPVVLYARDPAARAHLGLLPAVPSPGAVGRGSRPGGEPGRPRHRRKRAAAGRYPPAAEAGLTGGSRGTACSPAGPGLAGGRGQRRGGRAGRRRRSALVASGVGTAGRWLTARRYYRGHASWTATASDTTRDGRLQRS